MSYLVLARKFRPQTFDSIIGQEHITTALKNAILRDRVPHALLFNGPRGVGKTSAARVLARTLNCTGRALPKEGSSEEEARRLVEPCGTCTNCVEIARSSSMAVWEIDGASHNSVDNVRELIESLRTLPPPGSRYKIYIIDEVHMLSTAAFNALLKSLEEPPPNTIFVFATTEPQKIPETVISRCQQHDFRRLTIETIVSQLRMIAVQEGINASDDVCRFIARRAQGGMRDAQSLLDRLIAAAPEKTLDLGLALRVFRSAGQDFFLSLSQAVFEKDHTRCFSLVDRVFEESLDIRTFLGDFLGHFRALLLLKLSSADRTEQLRDVLQLDAAEIDALRAQLDTATEFDLERLFEIAIGTCEQCLVSNFPRYVLEAGLAKMASLPSLEPLPRILERLESALSGADSCGPGLGARDALPAATSTSSAKAAPTPRAASPVAPGFQGTSEVSKPAARAQYNAPSFAAPEPASVEKPSSSITEALSSSASAKALLGWPQFVECVGKKPLPVLHAHLKRVVAKSFVQGRLELEGASFDIEALSSPSNRTELTDCLRRFCADITWELRLTESPAPADSRALGTPSAPAPPEPQKKHSPLPGSLAAHEAEQRAERQKRLEQEARTQPPVQRILSTFEGSSIERVSLLKNES